MVDEGFGPGKVLDKADGADFVEVMFAKTLEEAKECCRLLEEVHIACRYEEDTPTSGDRGVAILVHEDSQIEAMEILSAREQNEELAADDLDMTDEDDLDEFEDSDDEDDDLDDDDDDEDDDFDDADDDEDDDELEDVY